MNKIIFGGYDTSANGIEIFAKYARSTPERQYERINIPGKNGVLLYDKEKYNNAPLEYGFIVRPITGQTVREGVIALRNNLLSKGGYQRLTDSFNTDEYYMAYYKGAMKVKYSDRDEFAKGTLTFERIPQRFLVAGETAITVTAASYTLTNPTLMDARPLIRVVGTGTFSVNGDTITVSENADYIDIDSELQDCFHEDENRNGAVSFASGEFPVFVPGNNAVAKSGITSLTITPRWWRL